MVGHDLDEDVVLALPDAALVRQVYDWLGRVEDDVASDALYWLVAEAFERFAPEAEWAEHVRYNREEYEASSPEDRAAELEACFDSTRRRQGARLIRPALEEG